MNMENKIDIPHTEREVFNKTFLYSVGLVVRFEKDNQMISKLNDFTKVLQGLGWNVSEHTELGNQYLKGKSTLLISQDRLLISMSKNEYHSFEDVESIFDKLSLLLQDCKPVQILLMKTNHFKIMPEKSHGKDWLMNLLLSDQYRANTILGTDDIFCSPEKSIQEFSTIHSLKKDESELLQIIFTSLKNKDFTTLKSDLRIMNDYLYDFWRWSFSKTVIDLMRNLK